MESIAVADGWSNKPFNALQPVTAISAITVISDTECTFGGFDLHNLEDSVRFIQVFFKKASTVILGTTAPDQTYILPKSSTGTPAHVEFNLFTIRLGPLSMACTTTETGATPGTGATGHVLYKA